MTFQQRNQTRSQLPALLRLPPHILLHRPIQPPQLNIPPSARQETPKPFHQMLRFGCAEQAVDGDVEGLSVGFAGVVVFAVLGENVRRDGVGASGVMGC